MQIKSMHIIEDKIPQPSFSTKVLIWSFCSPTKLNLVGIFQSCGVFSANLCLFSLELPNHPFNMQGFAFVCSDITKLPGSCLLRPLSLLRGFAWAASPAWKMVLGRGLCLSPESQPEPRSDFSCNDKEDYLLLLYSFFFFLEHSHAHTCNFSVLTYLINWLLFFSRKNFLPMTELQWEPVGLPLWLRISNMHIHTQTGLGESNLSYTVHCIRSDVCFPSKISKFLLLSDCRPLSLTHRMLLKKKKGSINTSLF